MSTLNNAFIAGKETTYGDAATAAALLTHGVEVTGHSYKLERPIRSSSAPRPGAQGEQADRNIIMNNGGSGTFKFDVLTSGFGFWLEFLLGASPVALTQVGATAAYTASAETTQAPPPGSLVLQGLQHDVAHAENLITHLGAVIHKWTLSHSVGSDNLNISCDFVSQDVVDTVAKGAAVYPAVGTLPYDGVSAPGMFSIDGGNARCVRTFELTVDLGYVLARKCIDGTKLLKRPHRSGFPTITGRMGLEWNGNDLTDAYKAARNVPIVGTYEGAEIETGHNNEFGITLPSCSIQSDPHVTFNAADASDVPMQNLEFKVQHDIAAGPMVTMDYKTADTSL